MANFHVIVGPDPDAVPEVLVVRKIDVSDLRIALLKGIDDFMAMPTHLAFLGIIYPLFGIALAGLTFSNDAFPLLFPLVSGFALMGPVAAVGLYELSRRRELGLDTSWTHLFDPLRSPALPAIAALGGVLMAIFILWLLSAQILYTWLYGPAPPPSYIGFLLELPTTPRGWALIIVGHALGFIFALMVFCVGVISFPLLLDRDCGALTAVQTSFRAVQENPVTMGLWGLLIAVLLVIGSAPLMVGLAIIMPVLGHASWHLYRRTVEPAGPPSAPPQG